LISVLVTIWPVSWEYAPGIVFGVAIALYFSLERWRTLSRSVLGLLAPIVFVGVSCLAYYVALTEAEWVLGTNGFATFNSYASGAALPALSVASFVGGCFGAFILGFGIRLLFLKFDIVRGLFLFSIFAGAVGSLTAIGFEMFGFMPQLIFPVWDAGLMFVVWYLRRADESTTAIHPFIKFGQPVA
jgi:hypothetical protein